MRKKKKKVTIQTSNKKIPLFLCFIILATIFLGIGYASISAVQLSLTGTAQANRQTGIVISNISYYSDVNANLNASHINTYYKTMMDSKVVLANDSSSSLTYQVTFTNLSENEKFFQGVVYDDDFYSNPDIDFEINGIDINDSVAGGQTKTITITFKYKEVQASYANTVLESYLNFKFDGTAIEEYAIEGLCEFHGQGNDIVGDCANGQHIDHINTGVAIFSNANHNNDFEISFTVDNIDPSRFRSGKVDTVFDCLYNESPYPGITFRIENSKWYLQVGTGVNNKKLSWNPNDIQAFSLKKANNKVYYSINGGYDVFVEDLTTITTFDNPLTIGTALETDGTPRSERFLIADLSHFKLVITDPGEVEVHERTYADIDQEILDFLGEPMRVAFSSPGQHTFDGSDANMINTGVELFNSTTYDDSFVITFTIDEFVKSQQTAQATLFNAKDESNNTYPGIMMRLSGNNFELAMKDGAGTVASVTLPLTTNRVNVIKKGMKMYYQVDYGDILALSTTNDFSSYPIANTFTIPTTFGGNINGNGAYDRKMKGILSDIKILVPASSP